MKPWPVAADRWAVCAVAALLALTAPAAAARIGARTGPSLRQAPLDALANTRLLSLLRSSSDARSFRILMRKGPETLDEYCSGEDGGMHVGTHVEADWMGYGIAYPGEIRDENKDGSLDIYYDDGFEEKNVKASRVTVVEDKKTKGDPKDDPACQLQNITKELKKKVKVVQQEVGKWIRAKAASDIQPVMEAKSAVDKLAGRGGSNGGAGGEEGRSGTGGEEGSGGAGGEEGSGGAGGEGSGGAGGEEGRSKEGRGGQGGRGGEEGQGGESGQGDKKGGGDEEGGGDGAGFEGDDKELAAAASAANGTKEQSEELKKLKAQLSEKDLEVEDLEKQVREVDKELSEGSSGAGKDSDGEDKKGVKTIDDLIAEYKARIARRDKRIEKLKAELAKKKEKLEAKKNPPEPEPEPEEPKGLKGLIEAPSLDDVGAKVKDLTRSVDEAKEKRAKLDDEGKMDVELEHSLDHIFREEALLADRFAELVGADKAAREAEEAAERRRKEAEAAARKAAELAGEAAEEVEANVEKAGKDVLESVKNLNTDVLSKATDFEEEVKQVKLGVVELDTQVHPHGEKWWRYRYEHAYLEALLMVFICLLMLIWERVYYYMRWKVYNISNAQEYDRITHGTMYISWLEFCAGELMTCLLVFLTCWALGESNAFELFPLWMKETEHIHLPNTGIEYRRLAVDCCVVFSCAIVFYYILMLTVVQATTHMLSVVAELEQKERNSRDELAEEPGSTEQPAAPAAGKDWWSRHTLGLHEGEEGLKTYNNLKAYFFSAVHNEPAVMAAFQSGNTEPFEPETFPFWVYTRLAVRANVDKLFQFGTPVWVSLCITFIALVFLHRFAHAGCVRVMALTFGVTVVVTAVMAWHIHNILAIIEGGASPSEGKETAEEGKETAESGEKNVHQKYNTEGFVMLIFHYLLFMMCYFAARMICQPWMWRLHFYLVLALTVTLAVLGVIFVMLVAPMLPEFCLALKMPPFCDKTDVKYMNEAMRIGTEVNKEEIALAARKAKAGAQQRVGPAKF